MAWDYPEGYPHSREEAVALMMTIKEEDIDLSDIPEITIPEGVKVKRLGEIRREKRGKNLDRLNQMFREYDEMKNTLSKLKQEHPEIFTEKEQKQPCTYSAQ